MLQILGNDANAIYKSLSQLVNYTKDQLVALPIESSTFTDIGIIQDYNIQLEELAADPEFLAKYSYGTRIDFASARGIIYMLSGKFDEAMKSLETSFFHYYKPRSSGRVAHEVRSGVIIFGTLLGICQEHLGNNEDANYAYECAKNCIGFELQNSLNIAIGRNASLMAAKNLMSNK